MASSVSADRVRRSVAHENAAAPLALRADSLTRIYPNGAVGLRGLDLTVRAGEVVGLLGRSGSGKTTLFRLLVGAIRPTSGSLDVFGVAPGQARPNDLQRLRRRMTWIGQQHNLVPGLSVAHNVLLGRLGREPLWRVLARLVYLPRGERRAAFEALTELGMASKLYERADDLSGGQQQRVAVARALIGEPELILADEPVSSVDERTARDVLAALLRLNERHGTTLLMSLHQPELALRHCPRVLVLSEGTLVYDGPPTGIDRATLYAHAAEPTWASVHNGAGSLAPPAANAEETVETLDARDA